MVKVRVYNAVNETETSKVIGDRKQTKKKTTYLSHLSSQGTLSWRMYVEIISNMISLPSQQNQTMKRNQYEPRLLQF